MPGQNAHWYGSCVNHPCCGGHSPGWSFRLSELRSKAMATPLWIRKMLELRGIHFEEMHHPEA